MAVLDDTRIGSIEGVHPGRTFFNRKELHLFRVHRALQAGIVGRGSKGAESIVLSGGYVDDEDHGDVIIYTGEGGRDQKTGRQVADQDFVKGNQALVKSCLEGLPVRVIRSSGHKSVHSPPLGYRYDGLFRVESYWTDVGKDGFRICRFRLVSFDRPSAFGPTFYEASDEDDGPPKRIEATVQRIVRDTALGRMVKALYKHRCQICGERIECIGGPYAEAAHIRPLGSPHHGPDALSNLLCLCPNHHVMLDRGALLIEDDFSVQPLATALTLHSSHKISHECVHYHRSIWDRL